MKLPKWASRKQRDNMLVNNLESGLIKRKAAGIVSLPTREKLMKFFLPYMRCGKTTYRSEILKLLTVRNTALCS